MVFAQREKEDVVGEGKSLPLPILVLPVGVLQIRLAKDRLTREKQAGY